MHFVQARVSAVLVAGRARADGDVAPQPLARRRASSRCSSAPRAARHPASATARASDRPSNAARGSQAESARRVDGRLQVPRDTLPGRCRSRRRGAPNRVAVRSGIAPLISIVRYDRQRVESSTRLDERAGRARVEAQPARAALIERRAIGLERQAADDLRQERSTIRARD